MPSYKPTIYFASGERQEITPENGNQFTLEELQIIVGGHIEIVPLGTGLMMVLNEEGKLKGLPYNAQATVLFNSGLRLWFDPIAGDVLVCSIRRLEGGEMYPDDPEPTA